MKEVLLRAVELDHLLVGNELAHAECAVGGFFQPHRLLPANLALHRQVLLCVLVVCGGGLRVRANDRLHGLKLAESSKVLVMHTPDHPLTSRIWQIVKVYSARRVKTALTKMKMLC